MDEMEVEFVDIARLTARLMLLKARSEGIDMGCTQAVTVVCVAAEAPMPWVAPSWSGSSIQR